MKTCWTSPICNAFGVTDTSSRRFRWKRLSHVIRTCPFEVLLQFSKRLEDVMKTCWTSSICNAFGVTDTSSRRVRWKRNRHVLVTSNGTLGCNQILWSWPYESPTSQKSSPIPAEPYSLLWFLPPPIRKRQIPTPWKDGNITALHKSMPSNSDRPNSLCQAGQNLERCVHKQLYNYINEHKLL